MRPLGAHLLLALLAAAASLGTAFSPTFPGLRTHGPSWAAGARLASLQAARRGPRRATTTILRAQAEASGGEQTVGAAEGASSGDWRALAEQVFEQDDRPIILYDGVCNLCNGGVNFMLDWDSPNEERGKFRFAALQSNVGRALLQRSGRKPDDCNSIILALKDGNTYAKGDAVLRIGQGLGKGTSLDPAAPILATVASYVVPTFLRDGIYDYVAQNRYKWFGEAPECRLWDDRFDERFVGELE